MTAVRYDVVRGVAWVILNEPENKNALNARILNGIGDGITAANADDSVRAIVLTHEGNTFCAGADLKGGGALEEARFSFPVVLSLMQDSRKPVVARIAGHVMGGGNGLAAAADISIASTDVNFGFTEVRIGVAPAMISVICMPKLSKADAAELFLTGRKVPAARIADMGMINRAVEPSELDMAVEELLGELCAAGPNALAESKKLLRNIPEMTREEGFAHTEALSAALFKSPEAAEGIAAFRERRAAAWVPQDRRTAKLPCMSEAAVDDGNGRAKRRPDRAWTEAALMQAALSLLERDGVLAGLSLKDVADEAGVNRGLIHHDFGSRQTLLRSALDREVKTLADRVGMEGYLNPARRGARLFRAQAEEMQLARMVMLLALDGDDELEPIPYKAESLDVLEQEQQNGVWREDLDMEALLALWYAMLSGYLALRPSLARQLGVSTKALDARILTTIGKMWEPLWHEGGEPTA
jgi:enoyl-CoA hydratase/carnithine racemase/AcrR family transcriptional regulator